MFAFTVEDVQRYGPLLGLVGTILGLLFTGLQVRKNTQIQRARFLLDLTNRDLDRDGAWDVFFKIESGEFHITSMAEFEKEDDSLALDALLYHFEIVGRLFRMGAITLREVDFYCYEIKIIFENPHVQKYLEWCDQNARSNNTKPPYSDARSVARRLGVQDKRTA